MRKGTHGHETSLLTQKNRSRIIMHFHSFRHIRGNQSDSQCSRNINYQNLWQHQIRNYGDGVESCIPLCTPSKAAVVASGTDFPDALAASSLAGHLNAPILLTDPKSLSNETANELNRLDANAIFVIGGNKAVSHNVENEIRATHPSATITRLTGSTRFDTAHSIYNELATLGAKPQTAIISTGFNFADALSISPYSYMQSAPFFLSSQSGLDEASLNTLRNFQTAIIVGGEQAVPTSVEQQLKSIGVSTVRIQGTTRYETSLEIGKFTLNNLSLDPSSVVYATGANFPDALSGSALAGINKTVLLLAQNDSSPTISASSMLPNVESVYVLGGQNAIGPATFNAISSSFGLSDREYVPQPTPNPQPEPDKPQPNPNNPVYGTHKAGQFCKKADLNKTDHDTRNGKLIVCKVANGDKQPRWHYV